MLEEYTPGRQRVTDVVVVVPGILGSRLVKDGSEVWGWSGAAIIRGIRTLGGSIRGLRLPRGLGDDHPGDGVQARGLLPDLHLCPGIGPAVDGYSGLVGWLRREFTLEPASGDTVGNLVEFDYDWRVSVRYNAARLRERAETALERWRARPGCGEARLVFVCHSMGGLVARYYLERLAADTSITRMLITLGTPYRGSMDALLKLVNGERYQIGPLGVDLSDLARSLPSLHQLTPGYACMGGDGPLRYPTELDLPGCDPELLKDAARLHRDINGSSESAPPSYACRPLVGLRQPTWVTATLDGERLVPSESIEDQTEGGDGRVPRFSARPRAFVQADRAEIGQVEAHSALQNRAAVRDLIWTWLTERPRDYRVAETTTPSAAALSVRTAELLPDGEPVEVQVDAPPHADRLGLKATAHPVAGGADVTRPLTNHGQGHYRTRFTDLAPGPYRVTVQDSADPANTVTNHLLIWE